MGTALEGTSTGVSIGGGRGSERKLQAAAVVIGSSSSSSSCCSGSVWIPTGNVQVDSENARSQAGEWHWSGGTATLVQLGDVVDRGPDSLPLLAFLKRLQVRSNT